MGSEHYVSGVVSLRKPFSTLDLLVEERFDQLIAKGRETCNKPCQGCHNQEYVTCGERLIPTKEEYLRNMKDDIR